MMKIRHTQTGIEREILRHSWENNLEYKDLRHLWDILDEGDPVWMMQFDPDNKEHLVLGLFDRDHAINMIKIDSNRYYYKEFSEKKTPNPLSTNKPAQSESEQIDEIIHAMNEGHLFVLHKDIPDLLRRSLHKAVSYKLIRAFGDAYKLDENGYDAIEMGGFDKWLEKRKGQNQTKTNNIIFHGPVSGPVINQDFLAESVSNQNLISPQKDPEVGNTKLTDQSTTAISLWQRIYNWTNHNAISAIIAALALGLVGFLIKRLGWF